jgi:adenylosuccinate synthase
LRPYVKETFLILQDALRRKKNILAEGAHGVLLDLDWGTYPYVTSSNIVPGALHAASGISPQEIKRIIGVVKAYQTRVGQGPFPTEEKNEIGAMLRAKGNEYGTTTGRPRRCGWLDLEALKFACELVRPTELVLTKLDVLDEFSEIPVAIGYRLGRRKVTFPQLTTEELFKVKPIYKVISRRDYISFIEKFVGVPIRYISLGPERHQIKIRK